MKPEFLRTYLFNSIGENMTDFAPGDVVCLKSGGIDMTVESIGEDLQGNPVVKCVWAETKGGSQRIFREEFPAVVLEKPEGGMPGIFVV